MAASRNVWRVWAATAAGVKGSAKVVPLYQSFHWSRKYGLSGLPLSPITMFSVEPSMLLQSMVKRCEGPRVRPTCFTVVPSPLCGWGPVPATRLMKGRSAASGCSTSTTCQLP